MSWCLIKLSSLHSFCVLLWLHWQPSTPSTVPDLSYMFAEISFYYEIRSVPSSVYVFCCITCRRLKPLYRSKDTNVYVLQTVDNNYSIWLSTFLTDHSCYFRRLPSPPPEFYRFWMHTFCRVQTYVFCLYPFAFSVYSVCVCVCARVRVQCRGIQIFQKYSSHLKILGARRVTWSKVHKEDSQTVGSTVQNLVIWVGLAPGICAPLC
jgi:hypothetical protein